ncbi:hypothetical protein ACWIGW_44150 [Nocardia brasiliensis]|uniref:hypothetical protein n=1 Tax=Streptomyces sp. NPDC056056 TaxID=3345698 RepID=UPI0035DF3F9D
MTTTLTSPADQSLDVDVDVETTFDALTASLATADPQLREEFAILLPRGRWWRSLSLRLADPDGRGPSIFHSRQSAENEMVDVTGIARTVFGVRRRDYRLRLMIRTVRVDDSGTAIASPWRAANLIADITAAR